MYDHQMRSCIRANNGRETISSHCTGKVIGSIREPEKVFLQVIEEAGVIDETLGSSVKR
jgi:hypothetical protein